MNAINNLIQFLNDNWTLLTAIAAGVFGICVKVKRWLKKSKVERQKAAIEAVRLSMLDLVTNAEKEFGTGAGVIKRSQVLNKIFEQYPVLAEALNIEDTTSMLDEMIEDALDDLREMLENNTEFYDLIYNVLTLTEEDLEAIE